MQSNDYLITHSGLAIIGQLLSQTQLGKRISDSIIKECPQPYVSNRDIVFSYIGLLCQGKNDFEAIEAFRKDKFFARALGTNKIPSCSIMRQRFDFAGQQWNDIILDESAKLLSKVEVNVTPCYDNYVPLDIDVSPFDNSNTKKEGVSYTYKGFDGYAPIFAYLGKEGYCVNAELRTGSTHCQAKTPEFIRNAILYSKMITNKPILARLDSGNDSFDNIEVCLSEETYVDFIIKRNLRKESKKAWVLIAEEHGIKNEVRDGKSEYIGEVYTKVKNVNEKVRMVFQVIVRTTTAEGQVLLEPDIEVNTWWTSLTIPAENVIKLYCDHGTSEQFHSELKTDLDIERLPSGKFSTNDLILHLGVFAYNLLRMIGQESIKTDDSPIKRKVTRRRLKTIIQNYITLASRMVYHARRYFLKFGCQSPWFSSFQRVYMAFSCG